MGEGVIGVRACMNVCIHVCDRNTHTHTHTHTYTHTEGETAEHASLIHQMKKNKKNVSLGYIYIIAASIHLHFRFPKPPAAGALAFFLLLPPASSFSALESPRGMPQAIHICATHFSDPCTAGSAAWIVRLSGSPRGAVDGKKSNADPRLGLACTPSSLKLVQPPSSTSLRYTSTVARLWKPF